MSVQALEKRKYARYVPSVYSLVLCDPSMCTLKDISCNGLSFVCYFKRNRDVNSFEEISIICEHAGGGEKFILLTNLGCNIVAISDEQNGLPFPSITKKVYHVQFKDLSSEQSAQLNYFISNYAIKNDTLK